MRALEILSIGIFLVFSLSVQAQEQGHPTLESSGNKSEVTISTELLASRGFTFSSRQRQMCEINGSEGSCRVEAFVAEETTTDQTAYTCSKLDKSTYVGHCVKGTLEGLSLLVADGSTKSTKEAFVSYFHEGRIAFPALTSYLTGGRNFGVQEKRKSYGCVYFGKWDKSGERCALFADVYGSDIFTESNALKLREGNFDLNHYRLKFLEFVQGK